MRQKKQGSGKRSKRSRSRNKELYPKGHKIEEDISSSEEDSFDDS